MEALDRKVISVFGDLAVNKWLALRREVSRLPRFISEYLVSKYIRDHESLEEAFRKIEGIVSELFPEPKDRDRILHRLMNEGKVRVVDEFKVDVDLHKNIYRLHVPSLRIDNAIASDDVVKNNERLLSGMWGLGVLVHEPSLAGSFKDLLPVMLMDFEPFQVVNIDLRGFAEGRRSFTLNEWVDLLITTVGLNPRAYSERQKMLLLARLIPLVEGNVNLVELGPRATGKTYLYRNISYYTRIYSGGSVSPARLFYDARLRVAGDIVTHDAVIFDEASRIRFMNADEMLGKLKDYMVDGFFERGSLKRARSDCSLVFLGNIDEEDLAAGTIRRALPESVRSDSAFLDRIHGIIPGWELPKIMRSEEHLARGWGLAADYFAEAMHQMRRESFSDLVGWHIEPVNFTIRDEKAVLRLSSGLLKLLFPHGEFDRREIEFVIKLAVELRQRVVNELSLISPSEFPRKVLEFRVRG